jgi:hypothetical protein
MSELPTTCPKCQGKMVQGYLRDFAPPTSDVDLWVEGPPKRKGYFVSTLDSSFRQRLPVATFRCEACGYLESYASKGFGAE